MSEQITVLFTNIRRFNGKHVDGESDFWCPERGKEYCVTLERIDETLVYLTLPNGFRMGFSPPGQSTNYTVVREGWRADQGITTLVKQPGMRPPSTPILESALTLEIEPTKHYSSLTNSEYLIYKLPRILNGLLVDRGRCDQDQETVADRANPKCVGELLAQASFMLCSRNNNLRYQCVSFQIRNLTSKKNLTTQYFCGSLSTV